MLKSFGGKPISEPLIQIALDPDTGIPSYQMWCHDKYEPARGWHWFSFGYTMAMQASQARQIAIRTLDLKGLRNLRGLPT